MDGLIEISLTKVYYLLKPANSRSINAARHKHAPDIRLGTKLCDVSKENPNPLEYFVTAANIRQLGALYPDECVHFSCDSKVKIHIGGQAMSNTISYIHSSPVMINHTMQIMTSCTRAFDRA